MIRHACAGRSESDKCSVSRTHYQLSPPPEAPPPPSPPPPPPSPSPPATNCPEYWERQGCGWTLTTPCEQTTPETTPDRCYDDPTYRETTLTGMNCHEWAH